MYSIKSKVGGIEMNCEECGDVDECYEECQCEECIQIGIDRMESMNDID